MNALTVIVLCMVVLVSTTDASAQSLKDKFKKKTEKVTRQVKQEASKKLSSKKSDKTLKQSSNKIIQNNTSLPNSLKNRTALFAPITTKGQIDAKHGIKSIKAEKPPKDETKQPDWNDNRTNLYEMDNKSIVEEFLILHECMESKYLQPTSPAAHRYFEVKRELWNRVETLDRMVEHYNEFKDFYTEGDGFDEGESKLMESLLKTGTYQRVVRSSIEPFFIHHKGIDLEFFVEKQTKAYFEAHGGYVNAHKVKWTVWNPYNH